MILPSNLSKHVTFNHFLMYNNYSIFDRNQTKNSYNNCSIELKQSAVLDGVNCELDSYTNKLN